MVYFIKSTGDYEKNINLICKAMFNMEQNKCIFDKNGNPNLTETSNQSFTKVNS